MKKFILAIITVSTFLFSACTILPEGSKKPEVNIEKITLITQNNEVGFNVDFSVFHQSKTDLPIDKVKITIKRDNKVIASLDESISRSVIPTNEKLLYTRFVPYEKVEAVEEESLKLNRMLSMWISCELELHVVPEIQQNSYINPETHYEGVVLHDIK